MGTDDRISRNNILEIADNVLRTILQKHSDITVMIADREGRCVSSTLSTIKAFEQSSCILEFTDKAKVLLRKLLPDEELTFVRIRGRTNEIIITFDEIVEIITIQHDKDEDS